MQDDVVDTSVEAAKEYAIQFGPKATAAIFTLAAYGAASMGRDVYGLVNKIRAKRASNEETPEVTPQAPRAVA